MPTATAATRSLSPAEVVAFQRDGFIVVPHLYTAEQMLEWKRLIQGVLEEEKKQAGDSWNMATSGVRVWNVEAIHPSLLAAMKDEHVTPILKQIIGPDVEFLSAKAVFKNDATSFASPWHQDWFYWEGAHKISVWIAMDDATPENGCLKMIPGSHKRAFDKTVRDGNAFVNQIDDKELEGLPVSTLAVERGGAVFFHDRAVHSSYPNTARKDRWSLISTYRDASAPDECQDSLKEFWKKPMVVSGKSVNGGG
jgi:ectoine hydroxylase-related dioxygenase (phytanoyl-CoA dioxygenase family)